MFVVYISDSASKMEVYVLLLTRYMSWGEIARYSSESKVSQKGRIISTHFQNESK